MTATYDDVLSKADLENLDSFLTAWERVTTLLSVIPAAMKDLDSGDLAARQRECADLRRKLAVAIHLGGLS